MSLSTPVGTPRIIKKKHLESTLVAAPVIFSSREAQKSSDLSMFIYHLSFSGLTLRTNS